MKKIITTLLILSAIVIFLLWAVIRFYSPADVGTELFKTLLQLLVIGVFGSVVSFIFEEINFQRKQDEALREFRKTILIKLNEAYARTKKARRLL
jgi:hypothetical protein